jgi:pimeloyl-ACP methyl ester carboxylesterase
MKRPLVLVPGLWMPGPLMAVLACRLQRAYDVHLFGYSGRAPYEDNLEALARFSAGRSLFVGHSLGGVLILDMLNRHAEIEADAVVLVGAPVRGCAAGRRLARARVGRWMLGGCRALWDEHPARWTRAAPLGVIAGTAPIGLGRALGGLPGANDGVVCVDETVVDGMRDRALVPCGHSMLIVSGKVSGLVERFLGAGRFA